MPDSTSRLALAKPLGTDAASELRLSIAANAETLDNAVLVTSGDLVDQPDAGTVGNEYYATDTNQWFRDTGSVWMPAAPEFVTTLPDSPYDGQEVFYQADATGGVNWHFRYNAESSSSYKWESVGGAPWHVDTGTGTASTGSGTPANTDEPFGSWQTLVLPGTYVVRFGATIETDTAPIWAAYVTCNVATFSIACPVLTLGDSTPAGSVQQLATVAANTELQLSVSINTAAKATTVSEAWIDVLPVRVS